MGIFDFAPKFMVDFRLTGWGMGGNLTVDETPASEVPPEGAYGLRGTYDLI